MSDAERMFDACIKIAEVIAKRRAAIREARRLLRNEKARKRYAANKRKPKPKKEKCVEPRYESPTSCYCQTCGRPPCSWCENGGGEDQGAQP